MFDGTTDDHRHSHSQNRTAVIPTTEKLNADERLTGRGIRIAFLDSGFYPHPDFADRVVAFHDISSEERSFGPSLAPAAHHWHGTQTVSACAGNGSLSNGVYRGLAYQAELVLVKVSRSGRIGDKEIEAGLHWVIENRQRYRIRVLNISLGGDCDLATADSRINTLVEMLIAGGVAVTVAAGNRSEMRSIPPASSPSAITVGGFSDENRLSRLKPELYHSSFGHTADGLVKPELIAPAMFVAVPILPGTTDYKIAGSLSGLAGAPDYSFRSALEGSWSAAGLDENILDGEDAAARRAVDDAIQRRKIVAAHYQHADGTSFAAPITASVIAQMIEANPSLTPAAVKNILISTATRLGGHPAIRQGFGVVNARLAADRARAETHVLDSSAHHPPRIEADSIAFSFHDHHARSVSLAGDFNAWNTTSNPLALCEDKIWRVRIPCQPAGSYRYKFHVDGARWTEDPSHLLKEDDGFGGFNSLLLVAGKSE